MSSRDTGGIATVALTVGSWSKLVDDTVTAAVGILTVSPVTCMGAAIIVPALAKVAGPVITPAGGIGAGAVRFVLRLVAMQTTTITAGIPIKQTIMPQIPRETKTVVVIAALESVRL